MKNLSFVCLTICLFGTAAQASVARTDRTVFVQLFEWTWKDIAKECETFLGPKGFAAVQVSPPNEHAMLPGHPWYERYQPVTYQLHSRSGSRDEFADMVRRCKAQGVDIYVDAVLNHMTWVNRSGNRKFGSAGSFYEEYRYQDTYQPWDFHHCSRNGDDKIRNYQDRWEVQNCELDSLADLKTESDWVRHRLGTYLNDLASLGVAGFKIDTAKHMPAADIRGILDHLSSPSYIFQEVIDPGSEPIKADEYFQNGDVNEFKYPRELARAFTEGKLSWLSHFGQSWGFIPSEKAVVFVDNHDLQRGQGGGGRALTHRDAQLYVLANIFMLAWPYGYPQVMSSYSFNHPEQGPPTNSRGDIQSVYSNGVNNCGVDWVCEHRWDSIANMVQFRNVTQSAEVTHWWTNGENQIAFSRGDKGFLVINKDTTTLFKKFQTGLPQGRYCDIILGLNSETEANCVGKMVSVDQQGFAEIVIEPWQAVAIHVGARIK